MQHETGLLVMNLVCAARTLILWSKIEAAHIGVGENKLHAAGKAADAFGAFIQRWRI